MMTTTKTTTKSNYDKNNHAKENLNKEEKIYLKYIFFKHEFLKQSQCYYPHTLRGILYAEFQFNDFTFPHECLASCVVKQVTKL